MIKPIKDLILIDPVEINTETSSGLIISTESKSEKNVAKVVSVGEQVKEVSAGDTIIFENYATKKIEYDSKEYILINEEKILAKLIN